MGLTPTTSRRGRRGGFTLVELLVGVVVCAMVAGATAASISQLARLRSTSAARRQAYARADAAASRIAHDAFAACRHHDLLFAKVQLIDAPAGQPFDELLLLSRALRPVRAGADENPEGGEYEVQYRVEPAPSLPSGIALWRRADPAFDPAVDAGGVADAAVAGVTSLSIQAYDGESWYDGWDSDSDGLPHGLRVTLTASSDDGRVSVVSRRVIPFDSIPIPPQTEEKTDTGTPSDSGTTGTSGTTTGTTGGGR